MSRTAYAEAGVDVAAGERAVDLFRDRLSRAGHLDGEFGSLIEVPDGMRRPVLVTSTDGVGTKTEIARMLGRFDTIGQDLVAMCADDVVCHGASPSFFLDYIAVGRLDPDRVANIVRGIGDACASIDCALVGGETAEHPGVMGADDFDVAGFCGGFVERDEVIDASASRAGDAIIGLASSGLHSNGYSLVRRLVSDGSLPLTDELLTPTRLYAPAVRALIDGLRADGLRIGGLAHITGGGLRRNVPRAVGDTLATRVSVDAWQEPPIFNDIARAASVTGPEMRGTFNCGIGFAVIVEPAAAQPALDVLAQRGIEAWVIGDVVPAGGAHHPRYIEA
jgi:phosphoribosylformylglycinamidine cyclo-ligase